MKRALALLLALLLLPTSALANSWGLRGNLLTAVMADDRWDDYTDMDEIGDIAAMRSRYHNALMLVRGKKAPLEVYTRALWQPDDNQESARLTAVRDGFELRYEKSGESFRFQLSDDRYILTQARAGEMTYTMQEGNPGHYDVTDGHRTATWYGGHNGLSLGRFSIRLMPRTWEELLRLKTMLAALDSGRDVLGWWEDEASSGRLYTPGKKGTVPVYGAPTDKAWRAGKGKASVSLKGDIHVLREWINDKGETWLHIRYEVSQRTHRFGFIKASQLPGYKVVGSDVYTAINVPVRTAVSTTLTDDPLVSQFSQFDLPAGVEMTCVGVFDDVYALVQTEIGGKAAWLFAPLKDLEPVPGTVLPDVMAQLDGCWEYWAGGSMGPDHLRLNADGTFYNPAWPEDGGTWVVTAYDPARGKYWNDPPYEIAFFYHDGAVNIRGLSIDEPVDTGDGIPRDGFSLTNWEGGGGYVRIDEGDVIPWEHENGFG